MCDSSWIEKSGTCILKPFIMIYVLENFQLMQKCVTERVKLNLVSSPSMLHVFKFTTFI
jgi:hypothetical protein